MTCGQIWPTACFRKYSLLEHSHALSLMHCLWLVSHLSSRAEELQERPHGLQSLQTSKSSNFNSLQTIYYQVLYGKSL